MIKLRQKNQSNSSKSVRARKVFYFFYWQNGSHVKIDLFTGTLVIFSVLSNYFTGHVHGKPGSVEPLYLELEQNTSNSDPSLSIHHEKFSVDESQISSDNIPDSIRSSLFAFCEKCSDSQKKKVEQILLLLFNFNRAEEPTEIRRNKHGNFSLSSSTPFSSSLYNKLGGINKPLKKVRKTVHDLDEKKVYLGSKKKSRYRATSEPKSSAFVPTPDVQYYKFSSNEYLEDNHGVIQLPTISTTPKPSSTVLPSRVLSLYPKYFVTKSASTSSTPFPSPGSISTTVSSALGPVQSVEMPTPPIPPTTSGPIYLYYMNSPRSTSSASSSIQPPTTPVVESSLASRPTTIEP